MKVKAIIKHNYGQPLIYVLVSPAKHAISKLTGRKTINRRDIAALKVLGIDVEIVWPEEADEYI